MSTALEHTATAGQIQQPWIVLYGDGAMAYQCQAQTKGQAMQKCISANPAQPVLQAWPMTAAAGAQHAGLHL